MRRWGSPTFCMYLVGVIYSVSLVRVDGALVKLCAPAGVSVILPSTPTQPGGTRPVTLVQMSA